MFARTSRKLSRAASAAPALNSRSALLAFAAIAAMTAALSTPAAAEPTKIFRNVNMGALLDACLKMGSACKLTMDGDSNGGFWIRTDHSAVYCSSGDGNCAGGTFVAHQPDKGAIGPQPRPVIGGISAGGNPGSNNPGSPVPPVRTLGGTTRTPVIHPPIVVSSNPVSSKPTGTIFMANGRHK